MSVFKERCIALRKQDFTLPEIAKITGRPKSSVHFHIQTIPLSIHKQQKIREANVMRIRQAALRRRIASARLFKKFTAWDVDLVGLVAHLLFDGEIKRGGCFYNNRNTALLERVEKGMRRIYPIAPKRYMNMRTGVSRISYFNVSLGEYMKEKSLQLLQEIGALAKNYKREFLRSFFDDEGCIDFRPNENYRRIRGYQKDTQILKIVKQLLEDFGIESRIQLPNEIIIVRRENFVKFQREINFSAGVTINGGRSNSIWRESHEKRDLLNRAIASYKPIGSNGVHRG